MKKLIIILFVLIVAMVAGMIYMGTTDVTVKQNRIEREITPVIPTSQGETQQSGQEDNTTSPLPSPIHNGAQQN